MDSVAFVQQTLGHIRFAPALAVDKAAHTRREARECHADIHDRRAHRFVSEAGCLDDAAGNGLQRTNDRAQTRDRGVGRVGDTADVSERRRDRRGQCGDLPIDFIERRIQALERARDRRAHNENAYPNEQDAQSGTNGKNKMGPIR